MSVVRCEVVECFVTVGTGEGTLRYSFSVRLEMTIETRLLSETLITMRALVLFLSFFASNQFNLKKTEPQKRSGKWDHMI